MDELPLWISLTGLQADVVVIDCPNRQGGPLTLSALNAADTVVYAATATSDGIDGVDGARRTVAQFRRHRSSSVPRTPSPRPASSSAG